MMVVAICITALNGWAMQRYELGRIAEMLEEGNRKRTLEMINEGRKELRELINRLDERMAEIGEGFTKMDERFAKIYKKFARMDEEFARMDKRFETLLKAIEMHVKSSVSQHEEI